MNTDLDFDVVEPHRGTAGPTGQRRPTPNQLAYIDDLRAAWTEAETERRELLGEPPLKPIAWVDPIGFEQASRMIDMGKDARDDVRAALREARATARELSVTPSVEVTEGMWIIGTVGSPDAVIYKVQRAVTSTGRLYAKQLVRSLDGGNDSFEYAPGALAVLAREGRRMDLAEAKAFGALYGTCCRCGRLLTDESSIAAGIGPVCAGKL